MKVVCIMFPVCGLLLVTLCFTCGHPDSWAQGADHVINGEQIMPPHLSLARTGHTPHRRQKLASLIWCNSQKSWTLIDNRPTCTNLNFRIVVCRCILFFRRKTEMNEDVFFLDLQNDMTPKKIFHQKLEAGQLFAKSWLLCHYLKEQHHVSFILQVSISYVIREFTN